MLSMTVFTNDDIASIPILQEKNFPPLPDLDINVRGITKLLEKLNPQKATIPSHYHLVPLVGGLDVRNKLISSQTKKVYTIPIPHSLNVTGTR